MQLRIRALARAGDGDGVVVGGGAAAARYLRPLIGKAIKPWPRFFGASFRFDAPLSRHLGYVELRGVFETDSGQVRAV